MCAQITDSMEQAIGNHYTLKNKVLGKKNESKKSDIQRPSIFWAATEGFRAAVELGTYVPFQFLSRLQEDGDGHPVLILPGFMASDFSTLPLRNFIHKLGYKVYGWGEGRNYACEEYVDSLLDRVDAIYRKHGVKVSLIGWSLGGIYARQLGKARPHKVRQIITLGSPFRDVTKANNAKWMYDLLTRGKGESKLQKALIEDIPNPAPVPTTAIYSKEDGVVPWRLCMEQEENMIHQNIQVRGSHFGLGVNPSVLKIIANRLPFSQENWQRFEAVGILEDILLYPST